MNLLITNELGKIKVQNVLTIKEYGDHIQISYMDRTAIGKLTDKPYLATMTVPIKHLNTLTILPIGININTEEYDEYFSMNNMQVDPENQY